MHPVFFWSAIAAVVVICAVVSAILAVKMMNRSSSAPVQTATNVQQGTENPRSPHEQPAATGPSGTLDTVATTTKPSGPAKEDKPPIVSAAPSVDPEA